MGAKQRPPAIDPVTLGLPHVGVDSHAHLDSTGLWDDLDNVLARASAAGVAQVAQVFMGPAAYHAGRSAFDQHPQVFFILGVHPTDAHDATDAALADIEALCRADARIRAVGEIGLDFYWDKATPVDQDRAFRAQLELARSLELPVVIHSRDSYAQALDVLLDMGFSQRPVLWHCFGGDAAMAREIEAHGWHISLPGPITYGKNQALREAAAAVSLDRLLVETDCPYLAPEPYRGRRNEPAFAAFTATRLAHARGIDPASAWQATGDNARRFFSID